MPAITRNVTAIAKFMINQHFSLFYSSVQFQFYFSFVSLEDSSKLCGKPWNAKPNSPYHQTEVPNVITIYSITRNVVAMSDKLQIDTFYNNLLNGKIIVQ